MYEYRNSGWADDASIASARDDFLFVCFSVFVTLPWMGVNTKLNPFRNALPLGGHSDSNFK